jgi:carboxyvinyl-carboxyphosphonate phosphorylmutase
VTTFRQRRYGLRALLSGDRCMRPGSVYDAISVRIAEDLGFEVGMFGGSAASLAILGDPDIALITLSELTEQMRRMSRAGSLPVLVDADHGYGNALNVRRTVEELEAAGAAGLTIEDTLLPAAFGEAKAQLISPEEGLGKVKAALNARQDPALVIVGRTGAASITSVDDAIARAKSYEAAGVDAVMFTGLKSRAELQAASLRPRCRSCWAVPPTTWIGISSAPSASASPFRAMRRSPRRPLPSMRLLKRYAKVRGRRS